MDPYGAIALAIVAVPVVTTAVLTKKAMGHFSGSDGHKAKSVNYIDLMVISSLFGEGVVCHVRAYPSGVVHKR